MATKTVRSATSSTDWRVVASDGVNYASIADMTTAGKVAYPGLDAGQRLVRLTLQSENGSGAAGDDFHFALNKSAAPSDNLAADFVATGSPPRVVRDTQIWNVWIKKVTGGDSVVLTGETEYD